MGNIWITSWDFNACKYDRCCCKITWVLGNVLFYYVNGQDHFKDETHENFRAELLFKKSAPNFTRNIYKKSSSRFGFYIWKLKNVYSGAFVKGKALCACVCLVCLCMCVCVWIEGLRKV